MAITREQFLTIQPGDLVRLEEDCNTQESLSALFGGDTA